MSVLKWIMLVISAGFAFLSLAVLNNGIWPHELMGIAWLVAVVTVFVGNE